MNPKFLISPLLYAGLCYSPSLSPLFAQSKSQAQVAFLADIHLQDVYGDFKSEEFKGIWNEKTGAFATIRTMESQLNSTRLFNENYFALRQALEELKEKKIKLVVLPGDYTDDGQPMNVQALKAILQEYAQGAGMRFFITTGNHDPVSPYGSPDGKNDFLGENGGNQAIYSERSPNLPAESVISPQLANWGYFQICEELKNFGFSPGPQDIFWTHPFLDFDYEGYDFEKVSKASAIEKRLFPDPKTGLMLPDASYLVEPVDGLWLLAIDGNVYTYTGDPNNPNPTGWSGSSMGFNLAAEAKKHQLEWIGRISQEAEKRGKTLISFSHYPLVDFHEGASDEMKKLFGSGKFQLTRVPDPQISERYAKAGIRIHFGGHMHINDTGILANDSAATLINIQVPSLAAFPPAYKIMNLESNQTMEVQTHLLQKVDRFDEFFDLYRMEYQWLSQTNRVRIWNSSILEASDYLDFNQQHLQELIRLRFLQTDWPADLGLLVNGISTSQLENWLDTPLQLRSELVETFIQNIRENGQIGEVMQDFYLIKNGGDVGINQLPTGRMNLYRTLSRKNLKPEGSLLNRQFSDFLGILSTLSQGLPSDDFFIDLQDLSIRKSN